MSTLGDSVRTLNSVVTFTWTSARFSRMPKPRSWWYCTRSVSLAMIGGHLACSVYLFRVGEARRSASGQLRLAEGLLCLCRYRREAVPIRVQTVLVFGGDVKAGVGGGGRMSGKGGEGRGLA